MAAGSLSPSHPLTLREKAHALFYPPTSLSLALSLSPSLSSTFNREFSLNFLKLLVLLALVESPSSSIQFIRFIRRFPTRSLPHFPSRAALRPQLPDYLRRSDVDLTLFLDPLFALPRVPLFCIPD